MVVTGFKPRMHQLLPPANVIFSPNNFLFDGKSEGIGYCIIFNKPFFTPEKGLIGLLKGPF